MIKKLFTLLIALPVAVAMIALAIANKHKVLLSFDPVNPDHPGWGVDFPLYYYLFAALLLGILMGGISTWFSQRRWRKMARQRTREASQWRKEADRLSRQLAMTREEKTGLPAEVQK